MESIVGTAVASFTDLLLDAVCLVDVAGRFVFVSAACEQIFGYSQQEMIGRKMIDMVAPDDRERTLAAARDVMRGQSHINFENRYVRKDGGMIHIMWSARWSEEDQLRVAVARDVTAIRQAQARQVALYEISEAAHASDDLADLFRRSHDIIGALLPAAGFAVALSGAGGERLHFAYHHGAAAHDALLQLLCEEVLRRNAPLLLEASPGAESPAGPSAELPAELPAALRRAAASLRGSALAVPLAAAQGCLGVLVLRSGDGARYTDRDRELLLFVAGQLAMAIERKQMHEQLRFMAMHDELTRLPNRRLFHDRLDTAFARAQRRRGQLSLLFIDVNRFKQVNDRYGHVCGDRLLQQVARRIGACVRKTDTLARLGGDEFVVLLENVSLPEDAEQVVTKIHLALETPLELGDGVCINVSVSIGVAHYPEHGENRQALLAHADTVMYRAKADAHTAPCR